MPDDFRSYSFSSLNKQLRGKVLDDRFSRGRYATDASIYQMIPHGVVVPECLDDVVAALDFARAKGLAVLPRGGGTSQCGQTVNEAIVIDNTKFLSRLISLDVEAQRCWV